MLETINNKNFFTLYIFIRNKTCCRKIFLLLMPMEFKVIFYVLVAIAYFIYTNYKKLAEQNKQRNLTLPPDVPSSSTPPVFQETKPVIKREPIKPKQIIRNIKPIAPAKRTSPLPVREKRKPEATSSDIVSLETPEALQQFYAESLKTEDAVKQEKIFSKNIFDLKTFRNAVILGEIINKPAWTKY